MSSDSAPPDPADGGWSPSPQDEQRLAQAQRSAMPWWRRSRWVAALQLALAAAVLVVVLLVQMNQGLLIENRYGFELLGAAVVTPFAAGAVVLTGLTLGLVIRRSTTGAVLLTVYGVLIAALFGQWLVMLFGDSTTGNKPLLLTIGTVVFLAAVAAAITGAATLGRLLRIGRIRDGIGVRTYGS